MAAASMTVSSEEPSWSGLVSHGPAMISSSVGRSSCSFCSMLANIVLNYWLTVIADGHTKLDQQISCELVNGYCPVTRT